MSRYYVPQSGTFDTILDIGKTVGGSVLNVFGEQKKAQGQAELLAAQLAAQQQQQQAATGGMPPWVLPVALVGGVGILALVLLKK